MNNYSFLDKMKEDFLDTLEQKSSTQIDIDDLSINYSCSLDEWLKKRLSLLQRNIDIFIHAKIDGDEVAMQSSLLISRTHAMGLSSFFDAIVEDIEVILNTGEWDGIPEEYKLPEKYKRNY
ncbi:hypothetical protein KSI86_20545 [Dickeya oryzae]|uniref:hypothetical protein n=1 Tax=Dickeya oryzae TaxID=1240404 RepID=UPI002097D9DB|nr:hypothetical protein [Dickeya oryzae]MCO7256548.1 hypothetical protein [Dickeya oryzae]